ncbi:MAG: ATP-binding protein [Caldilineaceae bacterium]|nr:ATP-binding protein [Caldilineaceae bacterium]
MPKPVQASTYNFRRIIEEGFVYVDKTRHLYELVRYGIGIYFLARPRRFGKSLLISTLSEIFRGNKELFQGLWIYDSDYKWQSYPIIHIDFSRYQVRNVQELEERIKLYLRQIAQEHQITLDENPFDVQWVELILKLSREQRVVILIDEYDKPILDNIENIEEAKAIRDTLKSFYGAIKSLDAHHRFVFITGISKFSRVGIFSDMNNLTDISMSPQFATMLGITEIELRNDFQEHIAERAQQLELSEAELLAELQRWYNGFRFAQQSQNVYNPYSTLQFFFNQHFSNYWFETGTPTFLIKLIKEQGFDIESLDHMEVPELGFSTYEIGKLSLVPLLFQTGYLTIKAFQRDQFGEFFILSYPNYEVKNAFLSYLLSAYNEMETALSESHLRRLIHALETNNLPQFFGVLEIFFANIAYDLQLDYEKYYQTIFYLIFLLIGVRIDAEVKTNQGRIDAVIALRRRIYLFEFKLNKSAAEALKQIRDHAYHQKYAGQGKPITLIGANFDTTQRKITEWVEEKLDEQPKDV